MLFEIYRTHFYATRDLSKNSIELPHYLIITNIHTFMYNNIIYLHVCLKSLI